MVECGQSQRRWKGLNVPDGNAFGVWRRKGGKEISRYKVFANNIESLETKPKRGWAGPEVPVGTPTVACVVIEEGFW